MRRRDYMGRFKKIGLSFNNDSKISNLSLGILGKRGVFGLQRRNIVFSFFYIMLGGFFYLRRVGSYRILFVMKIKISSIRINSLVN